MGVSSNRLQFFILCCILVANLPEFCESTRVVKNSARTAAAALAQKYQNLIELSSGQSLMGFGSRQFEKYIVETPRNYTMFLFLSDGKSTSSSPCAEARASLKIIADAYHSSAILEHNHEFFFAEISSKHSPEIFSRIGVPIYEVPILFRVPHRGMLANLIEMNTDMYAFEPRSIVKWIHLETGIEITINSKPVLGAHGHDDVGEILPALVPIATVAAYLYFMKRDFVIRIFFIMIEPRGVAYGIISCVLLFVSGFMYCHIEGAPIIYMNRRTKQMLFIHPSSQDQFFFETYLVYAIYGAMSYGFIQLIELPPNFKSMEKSKTLTQSGFSALAWYFIPLVVLMNLAKYKTG